MFQKINTYSLWCPDHRVLLCLGTHWWDPQHVDHCIESQLVLTGHLNQARVMCVKRNRKPDLLSHTDALKQIWSDYQILDDGWRGAIRVSESDWIHMHMTWFL